jgi:dihydroorotate dehydrogenase electron transfer subunit
MKKQGIYTVIKNERIAKSTFELVLEGDTSPFTAPGQFADVAVDGFFLRRPLSVCDWDKKCFTLIYKTIGEGTAALSKVPEGARLDVLAGLGNGFSLRAGRPLLIGGGLGVVPLLVLAKQLLAAGAKPAAALGFGCAEEIFLADRLAALGIRVLLATADGSLGTRGLVTQAVAQAPAHTDYFYACGPEPMLKAVCAMLKTDGQISLEERMACGFGACMGCTCQTIGGPKRVCRDGPVFSRDDILWAARA